MNTRIIRRLLLLTGAVTCVSVSYKYALAPEYLRTKLRKVEDRYPDGIFPAVMAGSTLGIVMSPLTDKKYLKYIYKSSPQAKFGMAFAAILSSLAYSKYAVNYYYRFISSPVCAVQDREFSQTCTTLNLALRYGIPSRIKGACFGITVAWGQHVCNGKDIISELQNPWIKNSSLLEHINFMQEKNLDQDKTIIVRPLVLDPDSSDGMKQFEAELNAITEEVVNKALDEPGQPYGLMLYSQPKSDDSREGHVFGVMASNENQKQIIKYFDSNNREATFYDKENAQKSLAIVVRYGGYGSMFVAKRPLKYDQDTIKKIPLVSIAKLEL